MVGKVLLGSHMSISGGIALAFERAARIGCTTMQVFTKNSTRWVGRTLTGEDVKHYKTAEARVGVSPVLAHATYLLNLCTPHPTTLKRSRSAFVDELERCEMLGINGLIFHPGSHLGKGEEDGIKRIAESLNFAHQKTPGYNTKTTLEITAGQGTAIGYRFEHLRQIIDLVEQRGRMAVCLDTCHLFAAGYEIHTEAGWERTVQLFDEILGLQRLLAIHVNDSRKPFNSRVDRHEHIGKGMIGLTAFRMLMNDPDFLRIPKILETEKSKDMHEDLENIALLRSLMTTDENT